jgi:hypothetical protein
MRDLDDDAVMRIMRRSAPKTDRPRLPPEYEDMFRAADVARAECYARMEHMTERFDEILMALDGVVVDVADGGDSLVNHIEDAVATLGAGSGR